MGMDVELCTDIDDQLKTDEYLDKYFYEHSLSRTFCHMLDREDVVDGPPELNQIGRITGIDISPILRLAYYINDELDYVLDGKESEEERRRILYSEALPKGNLKGNIDEILLTINSLIDKLSKIDNLSALLDDHGFDNLGHENYFTDFRIDKGDGYIGNNFGQDLRNFRKFLEYARMNGASTVYFSFG